MKHNAQQEFNQRDISRFLLMRVARPEDDKAVGDLLLRAFEQTYRSKLPHVLTNMPRKVELLDVASRRKDGVVYALELGFRILGTFSLVSPECRNTQSWVKNAANLRCLAIDPDFHGYGFSEMLLEESERVSRSWKCEGICLHVQKGATGVAKLYERRGFFRDPEGDMVSFGNENEAYYKPLKPL